MSFENNKNNDGQQHQVSKKDNLLKITGPKTFLKLLKALKKIKNMIKFNSKSITKTKIVHNFELQA